MGCYLRAKLFHCLLMLCKHLLHSINVNNNRVVPRVEIVAEGNISGIIC